MIENNDYWIQDGILIFKPKFNLTLDNDNHIQLLTQHNKLIFSNYNNPSECIKFLNGYKYSYGYRYRYTVRGNYIKSIFNQEVYLHDGLTHLTFGYAFNKKI